MSRNGWYGGGRGYMPFHLQPLKQTRGQRHNPALVKRESIPWYDYSEIQVRKFTAKEKKKKERT